MQCEISAIKRTTSGRSLKNNENSEILNFQKILCLIIFFFEAFLCNRSNEIEG